MSDAKLLTTEAMGTDEWRLIYAVYQAAWRNQDTCPPEVIRAIRALVLFYRELGRDHTGATKPGI